MLTKVNYHIHTDAINENLIPAKLTKLQISYVYANEADLLNLALFGKQHPNGELKIKRLQEISAILPPSNNW